MAVPLTLFDLAAAYASGTLPANVVHQIYARIAEVADPAIFISLRPLQDVLAEAEALGPFDPARPLWGVPFAVKDNIDVAGMPTTAACPAWERIADKDAFVVAKLRRAGALVIGKANLDQFATGLVGVRSPYGVPRNAVDPAIIPGGSSSGSAVAVAQGIVAFALGTDTAGSGRIPAGMNNIVGLKPTLGTISSTGVLPACRSAETVSILALTVADAQAIYRIAAGYDPEDPYSRPEPDNVRAAHGAGPLRIGIPDSTSLTFQGDEFQRQSFNQAVRLLSDAGHYIRPLDFSCLFEVAQLLYGGAWVAERHAVVEELMARNPSAMLDVTRAVIGRAASLSATDAFRDIHRLAGLKRQAAMLLDGIDMLCVPTCPRIWTLEEVAADPIGRNSDLGVYTNFVNLLDMCGLAVPIPAREDGRPGSVTLLAAAGQDASLAEASTCLEQAGPRTLGATGWALGPADSRVTDQSRTDAPLPEGHVALAVCGAHMAGLPLNGQLTSRGGRLLREAVSAPVYRLLALPGAGPARAGMVRTTSPQPTGIALELWSMPEAALGGLLTGIPAPLGLGRVLLDDGEEVCGFICEGVAVKHAEDITATGGWRNWLATRAGPAQSG